MANNSLSYSAHAFSKMLAKPAHAFAKLLSSTGRSSSRNMLSEALTSSSRALAGLTEGTAYTSVASYITTRAPAPVGNYQRLSRLVLALLDNQDRWARAGMNWYRRKKQPHMQNCNYSIHTDLVLSFFQALHRQEVIVQFLLPC